MNPDWLNLPYNPISQHYKKLFGQKVYKLPLSIVDDCPNRRGLNKMETCIFCDEWGSAANSDSFQKSIGQQIQDYKGYLHKNYKPKLFLAYFQSYTNSFMGVKKLQFFYEEVLKYEFIKGIIIGTRPDCLSPSLLRLWQDISKNHYVSVELGIQSFYQEHIDFLKRGHSAKKSIESIYKLAENSKIDIGLHFIFGLPNESKQQIIEQAKLCSSLPVHNVKLHNLHILKNTGLEQMYQEGLFQPIELEEYSDKVIAFLEHLRPDLPVQRLAALAPRPEELIAPQWTRYKKRTRQNIINKFKMQATYQGRLYTEQKNYALFQSFSETSRHYQDPQFLRGESLDS